MTNIAVFASGNGSNFQAVADACKNGTIAGDVVLVVCDKPGAFVEKRAEQAGVPLFSFSPKSYSSKAAFEMELVKKLHEQQADLIILAGYMRLIGENLLKAYEGRILNIHPSLLPAFPGLDAIGQALEAEVKVTGVTVHLVDEGMDTGPILAQKPVTIDTEDKRTDVEAKIRQIEHTLYPQTVQYWIEAYKGVEKH
ncbi:phosphoribosylglycinamide formyltransferase [Alkalicoccus halolimnae]|uniref:Phosphoribosylglycinamide formyltransferase n=1 Tax=Alkalicoccus halolimnae TaxID=1667239 RepID=A0A5C7FFE7_9BACI|nr:phosphoribosylglycinamide formyltransferase [Alkalicoccus halolimnae]TXF86047.1 phosphoribosylglycinamide formyltransferase [Alkalicoccus halolimnae]